MGKSVETLKLVASLEKASRKTGKAMWNDLALRLSAPSKHNVVVNIDKLNELAVQFKGKTLVVPGKVLARGELTEKVNVIAKEASAKAIEIISKKGEFVLLRDFVEKADKVKVSDLIIIK